MLEAISLASGSSGNCLLVQTKRTKILIDAGIPPSSIVKRLKYLGIHPGEISAILISHEHSDHCRGAFDLGTLYGIPIYLNQATFSELREKFAGVQAPKIIFPTTSQLKIGDFLVKTFPIFHDASDPVGFSVEYEKWKIVYLVDIGKVTEQNLKEIGASHLVIIDTNYDRHSLVKGKYPYKVKKRIMEYAHLSNEVVANVILHHPRKQIAEFWLAHLSKENNSPELACLTLNSILRRGMRQKPEIKFRVLPRNRIGPRWVAKEEQLIFPL